MRGLGLRGVLLEHAAHVQDAAPDGLHIGRQQLEHARLAREQVLRVDAPEEVGVRGERVRAVLAVAAQEAVGVGEAEHVCEVDAGRQVLVLAGRRLQRELRHDSHGQRAVSVFRGARDVHARRKGGVELVPRAAAVHGLGLLVEGVHERVRAVGAHEVLDGALHEQGSPVCTPSPCAILATRLACAMLACSSVCSKPCPSTEPSRSARHCC